MGIASASQREKWDLAQGRTTEPPHGFYARRSMVEIKARLRACIEVMLQVLERRVKL